MRSIFSLGTLRLSAASGLAPGAAVLTKEKTVNQSQLMNLAIAGAIVFAAYKWGNGMVKGAAISIGAIMAAKNIPYVKEYV